jgi:hypothetical protein
MIRAVIISILAAVISLAQQPVAPTPDRVGSPRGESWSDYNVVNSFELGYRFSTVGGNIDQYRSAVNYGNGIRLLGSFFSMNSKDGHGRFFDEIVATTQGLGNDPYQSATLRIGKNRLYRYDLSWRLNNYFNPGLTTNGAAGQHLLDTQYRMQDHDFTLFPESNLKFFVGYTGTIQDGPAYSSVQLFDSRGAIYPLFADIRRARHEYRVGNEFRFAGIRVNWMHGWDDFKEDTPTALPGAGSPFAPQPPGSTLDSFQRLEPFHGTNPYWRVFLTTERKYFNVNGRFTYTSGQRGFVVDESASGPGRFGAEQNRQIVTYGNAQRPVATGNLNLSLTPWTKLSIVNSTSLYNVRTSGDSTFSQFDNSTQSAQTLNYNYLGIRTFANETQLNYQFSPLVGAFGGYQYSDRRIASIEQATIAGLPSTVPANQTNILHSGMFGIRIRPMKPLSVLVSAEVGHNNNPFAPVSDKNYHALNGRVQYRAKSLLLSAGAESNYNVNSVSLSSYSSQSRKYFANGSWDAKSWLTLDASFSRMHLYTIGGIDYFANSQFVFGESSLYLSNINSIVGGARFAIGNRASLYVGYSRVQDVGDGRSTPVGPQTGSALPIFQAAQTFPMKFESPLARLSIRIAERLRWNFGYQYYGYREKFYTAQGYRANTGYSSLSISF